MIERIARNMKGNCTTQASDKILVALSGGADSVALLHTLKETGYHCVAAHCNFHLRRDESDRDEAFVRQLCQTWDIQLHVTHFNTTETAASLGISIEMAARQLRYEWFENLIDTLQLNLLATGHHADDSAETFFLNLLRGTGIKGLAGIKWRTGYIIRPLLSESRINIEEYCNANGLDYVTDSTNEEQHYLRNKIRHTIMPIFKQMNPSFLETMQHNMERMKEVGEIMAEKIEDFKHEALASEEETTLISKDILTQAKQPHLILFEILNPYGFSSTAIHDILYCISNNKIGRHFFTTNFRLIIDRHNLVLLKRNKEEEHSMYYIEKDQTNTEFPLKLTIKSYVRPDNFEIIKDKRLLLVDADKIEFPLTIRKWNHGDSFKPLGLNGFKKISDYLTDIKMRRDQKENLWILLSGTDICWIIGSRPDDRFKITNKTKNIVEIEWNE